MTDLFLRATVRRFDLVDGQRARDPAVGAAMRLVVFIVFCAAAARADIAPDVLAAGPGLAPAGDPRAAQAIAMKKEHVVIALHDDQDGPFAVVDATFSMAAPQQTKLTVTFPGDGVRVGDVYAVHPKLYGFHAWVDGKPVATRADDKTFTTQAGPPSNPYTKTRHETWHTFPASIDDDTVIRVRYAVAATSVAYDQAQGHAAVQYILHTGALWAGKIGEAVVEVKGVDVDIDATSLRTLAMPQVSLVSLKSARAPTVLPVGATRTKTSIVYTQRDLEPGDQDDVEVVFPRTGAIAWSAGPALEARMEAAAKGN
jgi:hypothetical protein